MPALDPVPGPSAARFATAAWSRVRDAAAAGDPAARPALADLCRAYWYPLYAFARRRGAGPAAAEDSVQGFFAWLMEADRLRYADPVRGRFRGFLVAMFRQFLARRHEYDTAQKRHPGSPLVSLDAADGEGRYAAEPADGATPDRVLEHAWAVAVVGRAMDRLRAEQTSAGRGGRFDALTGQTVAAVAGMTDGAVRVAVHRLRKRYAELLRAEVAATVGDPADVDDEIRHLLAALAPPDRA